MQRQLGRCDDGEYLKMVKSIVLAAGLALLVAVPEAAIADGL
jgi:hypothetical protein